MQVASAVPLKWEKVYVFISSTFNDMHAERDYLVKRVFPDLRVWCEQRKLRLIDIDLRWGVTEADAANKQALKVCLERINDCRPFFLCFLGQRHGWAPGESGISDDTFQEFPDLREALHPAASITELEIRHAIFRPFVSRDGKLPEAAEHAFFYFRDPDYLQALIAAPLQLLCIYTDDMGPDDETDKELVQRELSRVALENLKLEVETSPNAPHRPLRYSSRWHPDQETPELTMPLDCPHQDKKRWRETWNRFAHLNLSEADTSVPDPKRTAANQYNTTLIKGRLSEFQSSQSGRERFEAGIELANIIKHDLMDAILARHPERREPKETTDLQREIDQHDEFISNSVEGYIERIGDFAEIDEYIESDSKDLFVLTAPGGMGKSTLLGKWVDRYRAKIEGLKDHSIHARFIGQSDGSSTVYSLLRFLLREIKEVYQKFNVEIPSDPMELRKQWLDLLKAISERGKTILVIDALNQLESGLSDLTWLPRPVPENIKLIVSFKLDDQESKEVYQQFESSENVLLSEVRPFESEEDRKALVNVYLNQYLKQLDPDHLNALIQSPGATNPLYLKVVLSELRVFGAFANLREKISSDFGKTPVSAFEGVLARLEKDPTYSPIEPEAAVPLLFGLLAHARHGLSVDELRDIFIAALGLPDTPESHQAAADTVNLFLRQVRPFLARRETRYDFFYDNFKMATQQRYVADSDKEALPMRLAKDWHRFLADYFENLPTWWKAPAIGEPGVPSTRKVAELPYHLTNAQEWNRLEKILSDLEFIEAKCAAGITYELVEDYDSALAAAGLPEEVEVRVDHFARFLRAQSHVLARNPMVTFQQAANEPDSTAPAEVANQRMLEEKRPWLRWINKPLATSACLMTLAGHTDGVFSCAFSRDGRRIVSASHDKTLKIWDAKTAKELATLNGHSNEVNSCAFSPDGSRIVSASGDKTLKIWDAKTAKELATLARHTDYVTSCAFSPDGSRIVSASWDKTLKIWDAQIAEELATLAGHTDWVTSCAFSPDGSRIVSASYDETLKIWDAETDNELATLAGHTMGVTSCAFSRDGRRIVSASHDKTLKIWDAETGNELATLAGHIGDVNACAYSPDGSRIVSASSDKTVKIWDAQTGSELATLAGHTIQVHSCAYSPDGLLIASASRDATLKIWDVQTAKEIVTLAGHIDLVISCAYSPDGSRIVSASYDGSLKIWDAQTGVELVALAGHKFASSCAYSPDGGRIVSGSWDKTLKIWHAQTGQELATLAGHTDRVISCAYSPDGHRIVSASYDGTLKIWDAETANELATLAAHIGDVNACAYSPDGHRIVSASWDRTLKIWDAKTAKELATLAAHKDQVNSCVYSPDGGRIVSASGDETLKVWDAETGNEVATLAGHKDQVNSCAYSPDGRHIVSASSDRTLKIWDGVTGKELARYFVDAQLAAWNPDGSRLVVGTYVGAIHLLKLENIRLAPPVVTAWRNDHSVGFGCPFCRVWSQISTSHLGSELPCPHCGKHIKLNLFTIDADWRPIAAAWGKKA